MSGQLWATDQSGIAAAADAVKGGGVIGFPTDTVYGIGCTPSDKDAIGRLYEIKARPMDQPLILMAATWRDLDGYVEWPPAAAELVRRYWPGPLTLVVRAKRSAALLGGHGTVGVRIPAHQVALALLQESGALATTSANRHGDHPVPDARSAVALLAGLAGALADGSASPAEGAPSSILDLTREQPVLLREGRLSARELGVSAPGQGPGNRRD